MREFFAESTSDVLNFEFYCSELVAGGLKEIRTGAAKKCVCLKRFVRK
jgi:hypothetical protein